MIKSVAIFVAVLVGPVAEWAVAESPRAPRRLLPLLHAAETQTELGLTPEQVTKLENFFGQIDPLWLRTRHLTPDRQYEALGLLEGKTHQWLAAHFNNEQHNRVRQLELQAQGVRMLLRPEVAKKLALTPQQAQGFAARAEATELLTAKLQQGDASEDAESLRRQLAEAAQAEQAALESELTPEQHATLWELLGEPFDVAKLQRIYPMAPELQPADAWINSPPLTMQSLRGKVVVLHFYAFQCSNCHANFPIYRRWHEELRDRGVVVLGIQTPETASERDAALVEAAAAEQQLEFPILVDLDEANWKAWSNNMWPTVYVIDKRGYVRRWWQGELQWQGADGDQQIETAIAAALAEPGPATEP